MKEVYGTFGIYRIVNLTNNKCYVGKTSCNFGDRWDSHRSLLRGGKHTNKPLQNDWNRYGEDSFRFEVLQRVEDPSDLNRLEIEYIKKYKDAGLSYNIQDGGDTSYLIGKHMPEETKRKIGDKNRAHMLGRKLSDETRKRMSEAQKRRYEGWTDLDRVEHGKKTAQYASGYHWSDESKEKFSRMQWEKPNGAKFTASEIIDMRDRYANGTSIGALAEEYGTSPAYVTLIIKRKRWAHI